MYNEAFFNNQPMPSMDICLYGEFRVVNCVPQGCSNCEEFSMPLELGKIGWPNYHGVVSIQTVFNLDKEQAQRLTAISLELQEEDVVEVLVDGCCLGVGMRAPYIFEFPSMASGSHCLEFRLAGTNANLFGSPKDWGILAVEMHFKI